MAVRVTTDGLHLLSNNDHINTPIGSVICYAGQTTPHGWLFCNGTEVLKTTYPNLYAVIGNMYGTPSNSNPDYFVLPNLIEKFPIGRSNSVNSDFQLGNKGGVKTVTLEENQLPSHSHTGTTVANGQHNHTAIDGGHTHQYEDAYFAENDSELPIEKNKFFGTMAGTDSDNAYRFRKIPVDSNRDNDIHPSTYTGYANISLAESGSHTHTFTTNVTGSGNAVNILNPYLVLNYLIKY